MDSKGQIKEKKVNHNGWASNNSRNNNTSKKYIKNCKRTGMKTYKKIDGQN